MPPFARASDLDRILRCTGSLSLVTLRGPDKTEKSQGLIEAGNWGTDMHTVKETGEIPAHRVGHAPFMRKSQILRAARQDLWPDGAGKHEVSFAYDVLTQKVDVSYVQGKEAQDAWKASHADTCVVGTSDWVGWHLDMLHIDDLKTGHAEPNPESHQNMFYGLCASIVAGKGDVVLSSTHFPRYPVKGEPDRLWAGDDFFRLRRSDFVAELVGAYAVTQRQRRPSFINGPYQCAYCPVKEKCPV